MKLNLTICLLAVFVMIALDVVNIMFMHGSLVKTFVFIIGHHVDT